MQFQREGKAVVAKVSADRLVRELSTLRSEGPSSFASLTAPDGSYLQAAGGPFLFLVEHRRSTPSAHFRAFVKSPAVEFPDGTLLSFSAGKVALQQDEWITKPQVTELFASFLAGSSFPSHVHWRPAAGIST